MTMLGAEVWTYWIGVALALPAILVVLSIGVLYLVKVVKPRYPKS